MQKLPQGEATIEMLDDKVETVSFKCKQNGACLEIKLLCNI